VDGYFYTFRLEGLASPLLTLADLSFYSDFRLVLHELFDEVLSQSCLLPGCYLLLLLQLVLHHECLWLVLYVIQVKDVFLRLGCLALVPHLDAAECCVEPLSLLYLFEVLVDLSFLHGFTSLPLGPEVLLLVGSLALKLCNDVIIVFFHPHALLSNHAFLLLEAL